MDRQTRQAIRDRFFAIFDGVPTPRIAGLLDCSARTVDRLRGKGSVPTDTIAGTMATLIEQARQDAVLTEQEKLERDERRRARHEAHQRQVPLTPIKGGDEKEIPQWYARMREMIADGRYREAYELAYDRVHTDRDWQNIPDRTKPYVMGSFGVACYYTGRILEARDSYDKAVRIERQVSQNRPSATFLAGYLSNRGLANMRMWAFDDAFKDFQDALMTHAGMPQAYYNALCCASIAHDATRLSEWCGRLRDRAMHAMTQEDIEAVLDRHDSDGDLAWARAQEAFRETIDELKRIRASMTKGKAR